MQSKLLVHKHLQSVAQHSSEHCAPHRVAGHPQHTHSEVFDNLPSQLLILISDQENKTALQES